MSDLEHLKAAQQLCAEHKYDEAIAEARKIANTRVSIEAEILCISHEACFVGGHRAYGAIHPSAVVAVVDMP